MKKILTLISLITVIALTGCSRQEITVPNSNTLKIITSFYPLYEIANQIGGDIVSVKNIIPGGTEPHDYEPTARDIVDMREANLVIYNGLGLEPWKDKVIPDLTKNGVATMQMADLFGDTTIANDPHLWLDPVHYKKEAEEISKKIIELDPAHADAYRANTKNFIQQLDTLNASYEKGLTSCKFDTFITNHAAFAYIAKRYHLSMIPIAGLSPDIEPSPKAMADITNIIRQKNIRYVLTETLVSPKIADTLAESSGAETLIMNPIEGLTNQEISAGKNYVTTMEDNLRSLRTALECK
ncbi:MAG: zinc ABC transporter substrate-binding protein [Candidatus Peregrinibacteria bacterium]|nr:zinc ABC transporter substrate-binding protein [Candidatus Peregrinibacteria bacterium]